MKRRRRTETDEAPRWQGATTENIGQYLRKEQRSQRGCIAGRMQPAFHHGLLGMRNGYLSYAATVILQAAANGYRYGFDIMDATGLPSGTVYPALRRMEAASLIVSKWETPAVAQREQRPARKYYELTRSGRLALDEAASRYRLTERTEPRLGRPAPAKR